MQKKTRKTKGDYMIVKVNLEDFKKLVEKLDELERRLDKQNDINRRLSERIRCLEKKFNENSESDDDDNEEEEESDPKEELQEKFKEFDQAIKHMFSILDK